MISNRQSSSRRRGRGGSQRPSGGSSQGGQRDSGNRIDSRTRGNAAQLLEKYRNMARDAQMQGDRVNTEYYLQFADHYFRVLSDSRSRQDDHRPIRPVDDFDAIEEYGDEGEPIRAGEQGGFEQPRGNGSDQRHDGNRNDGNRQDGRDYQSRQERQNRDERQNGDDRARRDTRSQNRDGQSRDGQSRDGQSRDGQTRDGQSRDSRPREPQHEAAAQAPRGEGVEPQLDLNAAAAPRPEVANDAEGLPKSERKPRTRRTSAAAAPAPEMAGTFDADRLPPSLGIVGEAVAESEADAEPKPKRRRTSRAPASEVQAG